MARDRKPYTGILAKPLEPGYTVMEFGERIGALFEHYDIDPREPEAGFRLASKLATAHVPGFAASRSGRKSTFSAGEMIIIFVEVKKLTEAPHYLSVRAACEQLACEPRWKNYKGQKLSAEQTANQLREAYKAGRAAIRDFIRGEATHEQFVAVSILLGHSYQEAGGDQRELNALLVQIRLAQRRKRRLKRRDKH